MSTLGKHQGLSATAVTAPLSWFVAGLFLHSSRAIIRDATADLKGAA